jgi:hypothetical protein
MVPGKKKDSRKISVMIEKIPGKFGITSILLANFFQEQKIQNATFISRATSFYKTNPL